MSTTIQAFTKHHGFVINIANIIIFITQITQTSVRSKKI